MDVSNQKGNRQEEQKKEETRGEKSSIYRYLRHPFPYQNTLRRLKPIIYYLVKGENLKKLI